MWFGRINRWLGAFKGLPLFTVLSSFVVGGFQYYNEYQEKVSAQAKEDMKGATDTFTDVSKTIFRGADTRSRCCFRIFQTDSTTTSMPTSGPAPANTPRVSSATYEASATGLLESGDLIARTPKSISIGPATSNVTRHVEQPSGDPLSPARAEILRFRLQRISAAIPVRTDAEAAQAIRDGIRPPASSTDPNDWRARGTAPASTFARGKRPRSAGRRHHRLVQRETPGADAALLLRDLA